jgi:transposase-like protein
MPRFCSRTHSGFWSYWKRKVSDATTTREDVREALLWFFAFLRDIKGIENPKAIADLTW